MAVPTIASVSPTKGHTGGTVVLITGTNFRPQTPQVNPNGPLPKPPPSVEVLFGAVKATKVDVLSPTLLEVQTPKANKGVVSVTVRNIDDLGVLIGAETVTSAGAFTYAQPDLTQNQYMTRAIDALILGLRREIIDEVVPLTHGDYDDSTGDGLNITTLAAIPALVLLGPRLVNAPEISGTDAVEVAGDPVEVYRRKAVKHLRFRVIGVANNHRELFNLIHVTRVFFEKNAYVYVDKDEGDPSKGQNKHPLFVTEEPDDQSGPSGSNLRQFRAGFELHGVYFETIDGFDKDALAQRAYPADTVTLEPSVVFTPVE